MNMNRPVNAWSNYPNLVISLWEMDEPKDEWHFDIHESSADDVPLVHGRTLPWPLLRDAIWDAVEVAEADRARRV